MAICILSCIFVPEFQISKNKIARSRLGLTIEKYGARDAVYTDRHAECVDYSLDCLADDGQARLQPVSYTHLTLPTT